jgi:hypothetical protein
MIRYLETKGETMTLSDRITASGFDYNQPVKYVGPNDLYTDMIGHIQEFKAIGKGLFVMVDWADGETRNVSVESLSSAI